MFEYAVKALKDNDREHIEKLLNEMANEGWEYFSVIPAFVHISGHPEYYIFRKVKDQ